MAEATMRASDADRDRTAAVLRDGLAARRLTIEEFGQRLDQAYAGLADVLMPARWISGACAPPPVTALSCTVLQRGGWSCLPSPFTAK
jgi:hypothetical protein